MQNRADFAQFTVNGTPHQGFSPDFILGYRTKKSVQALYFHIPFCFHKCHYCDFYSLADDGPPQRQHDRHRQFLDALLAELSFFAGDGDIKPRTIFFGGGTPTLLAPELWVRLLATLKKWEILDRVVEFTVEANPETVTPELMQVLVEGGVNRISMGAQSFNPTHLKTLERWHDPASVVRAMEIIRNLPAGGLQNINLDLIFAIPGQTVDDVQADLRKVLELQPTHLSCYSLIYEPNTAMTQRLKMGQFQPTDEEIEREMYALVMQTLEAGGYEQYEISNWAKRSPANPPAAQPSPAQDYRCMHNLIYWRNENWLGIGPSAASHVDGVRWKNRPHLGQYLAHSPHPPVMDIEQLPPDRSVGEQLMLQLRLNEGVSLPWLEEHVPADDPRFATIDELVQLNLLERTATHLRLSGEGRFVADAVIGQLL